MEKDSLYIKVYNENINHIGKFVDCGCEVISVDSPHVTIKCCNFHDLQYREGFKKKLHISVGMESNRFCETPVISIPKEL